jgi:hypothetical protein
MTSRIFRDFQSLKIKFLEIKIDLLISQTSHLHSQSSSCSTLCNVSSWISVTKLLRSKYITLRMGIVRTVASRSQVSRPTASLQFPIY